MDCTELHIMLHKNFCRVNFMFLHCSTSQETCILLLDRSLNLFNYQCMRLVPQSPFFLTNYSYVTQGMPAAGPRAPFLFSRQLVCWHAQQVSPCCSFKACMEHWTDPNTADRHIFISGLDGNPKRRLGFSAVFRILIYWTKLNSLLYQYPRLGCEQMAIS